MSYLKNGSCCTATFAFRFLRNERGSRFLESCVLTLSLPLFDKATRADVSHNKMGSQRLRGRRRQTEQRRRHSLAAKVGRPSKCLAVPDAAVPCSPCPSVENVPQQEGSCANDDDDLPNVAGGSHGQPS